MSSNFENITLSQKRVNWIKPEIIAVVSGNQARTGNDSEPVDQIFPAANGSTVLS